MRRLILSGLILCLVPSLLYMIYPSGESMLEPPAHIRVFDGDTIGINEGTEERRIRYLLIDTPELHHPSRPVEELGEKAKLLNTILLSKGILRLEYDTERTDRYGRSLAYLFVDDKGREVFINEEIIRAGMALPMIINPNRRYVDRIIEALVDAKAAKRGLWGIASERVFSASQVWSEAPYLAGSFITMDLCVERIELSRNRILLREGKTAVIAYKGDETKGVFSLSAGDFIRVTGKLQLSFSGCELPVGSDIQVELLSD